MGKFKSFGQFFLSFPMSSHALPICSIADPIGFD